MKGMESMFAFCCDCTLKILVSFIFINTKDTIVHLILLILYNYVKTFLNKDRFCKTIAAVAFIDT